MNGITHKQAQRYIRADLDGLLTSAGRLDLETHLRDCEACRADSESLSTLTARLQTEFHSRWDAQDGPSKQVMANVQSQSRRIHMQKRIDFAFNIFGGIVTLLVLLFVISSVVSQFQKKSITSNGTQTNIPASSPEERLLAFTSRQSGNYEIYIVRSDGSDIRNITNHSASDVNPAWSPDGKRIAFQSDRSSSGYYSQIFLMDADGSNVVLLTTDKGNHELPLNFYGSNTNPWSPDGSKLLFLRQGLSEGEWILQSIDIENGDITSLATGRVSFSDISWSPDGKYIWFVLNDPQNTDLGKFVSQIHIVSADGTNLINISSLLPSDETLVPPYNFYWSRDGKSISFSTWIAPENTTRENYTSKLYKVGIDGSLTLEATTRSPIAGVWDGIYFISPPGPGGWTWVYPDGSTNTINPTKECEQERLYDSSTNSYTSAVASFSRSPNGNGVIIASCPDGNVHLSWVNSTGTEVTPIAKLSTAPVVGYMDWVQWSQDDKFIAFHLTGSDATDVHILSITESLKDPSIPPVKISLRLEFPFLPAWQAASNAEVAEENPTPETEENSNSSANGLIAFTSEKEGNNEIYTMRADGSEVTNITNDSANDNSPSWSPDGQYIAFESDRDGFMQIFRMNADGSDVIQLTNEEADHELGLKYGSGHSPWSPDGNRLIISQRPPGEEKWTLYSIDISAGNKIPLVNEPNMYRAISWSPDGKHIAFIVNDPQNPDVLRLYIVNTDGNDRRDITKSLQANEQLDGFSYDWSAEGQSLFFIAYKHISEGNDRWIAYEASVDGDTLVERATSSTPMDSWRDGTSFIIGFDTSLLTWLRSDGTYSTLKPLENCQMTNDSYFGFVAKRSFNGNLIIGVDCPNDDLWFYWSNSDGTFIKQLFDAPISVKDGGLNDIVWSPDDKYVAIDVYSVGVTYAYVVNVEASLKDPSVLPDPIGRGAIGYSVAWQPNP